MNVATLFLFVCLCPDRDSGDLPLWFRCCCYFDPSSFVEISSSQEGADDRSKGDGFQNAEEEGF